jgi:hypothetical protein
MSIPDTTFIVPPLEVELTSADMFLIIKETLTRMGISSTQKKTLYQSCHILHKRSKYYIMHFKEMFHLDGKTTTLDQADVQRRNTIAFLLQDFGLLTVVNPEQFIHNRAGTSQVTIIPFKEKRDWTLQPKYTIGVRK